MFTEKVFILTRPNNNKIISDKLSDIGFDSLSLPSLKIVPLDLKAIPLPENYDFVFFSSGNAVIYYLAKINNIYGFMKEWPTETIIVTVGSATADRFRSFNFINMNLLTILSPEPSAEQIDSESLWEVLRTKFLLGKKFLFVRGTTGRNWLINKVSQYCEVDICSLYSIDNIKWSIHDKEKLKLISDKFSIVIWLFTSIESIKATIENIVFLNLSDWFNSCKFIVTHHRIYNFLFNYFLKIGVSEKILIKECFPYNESIIETCKNI